MSFTIGSLFDGSGGFPLAASLCGGTPKWAAEVEPYPISVTKSRFPDMKHLGSVTDVKGGEVEPVDVITFGSPCQDLSVAGKRAGLKHEANGDDETTRSGLFMEAVRIIKEMREATNGVYPRFAVWENVPGAFSSNKGEDFRIVLEELIKVVEPTAVMPEVPKNGWPYADSYCGDGWSIAYRVLDAQFWGVPQRRRRIYLVLDLRGECAGKVSFEREGLRGYFETGRTPWQTIAGDAEGGSGAADCERNCVGWPLGFRPENVRVYDEVATTICNGTRPGFTCGVIEAVPVAYSFDALSSNSMKSSNPHSGCRQVDVSKCLDTTDPNPCKNQGGIAIVEQVPYTLKIRSGCEGGGKGALIQTDMSATLSTLNDQYLFQPICMATQQGGAEIMEDKCPTITASAGMSGNNQPVVCYPDMVLDDQGGSQISVRDDGKCPTLRAEMHGNVPCVLKEQHLFENHSQDSRYKGPLDVCPMLPAQLGTGGNNQPFVVESKVYESHPMDSRIKELDDVAPTVSAKWHKGAADTPLVCDCIPIHDQATRFSGKHGDKCDGKGNGLGVGNPDDPMNTLTSGDRHAVAFQTYQKVTGPLMANSHPGSYTGQDAFSDMLVAGTYQSTDGALCARDYKGVGSQYVGEDKLVVEATGVDCRNATEYPELTGALQADAAHNLNSNNVVRIQYIVRRLTPTECARLQGFPDTWGHPVEKTEFTDEEYQFWLNVRNTHAAINDKATKDYTKDQMLKWYNGLHTDSSEYKMWGNGIALPNALYVMQGIADVMAEEKASRKKWLDDLLGDCL